jgi:hypothetical protein
MNATSRQTNANYLDIDTLCTEAEEAGYAHADARAAYDALSETRKSVLAQGMKGYFEEGMTAAKSETLALADDAYLEFVRRMVKAGHAADRARVRYDILRTRIELLRTNSATERAAMSMR